MSTSGKLDTAADDFGGAPLSLPRDMSGLEPGLRPPGLAVQALIVLWPSFLMAGVLEMLVFAVVDPSELRWFGGELIGWSDRAIYTVTFLIFWGVISTACGLSSLLALPSDGKSRGLARHWP